MNFEKQFVCPIPDPWNQIYQQLLKAWEENPHGKDRPPIPLILAGWAFSGDGEKNYQWNNTILWAKEMGLDYLIPELMPEQCYFASKFNSNQQSRYRDEEFWNYDSRIKPSRESVDLALTKLQNQWCEIVGSELAAITSPLWFTGEKSRRLLVWGDPNSQPPWGTWAKKLTGEKGKAFTDFRRKINDAISPLEIDHIDFTHTEYRRK